MEQEEGISEQVKESKDEKLKVESKEKSNQDFLESNQDSNISKMISNAIDLLDSKPPSNIGSSNTLNTSKPPSNINTSANPTTSIASKAKKKGKKSSKAKASASSSSASVNVKESSSISTAGMVKKTSRKKASSRSVKDDAKSSSSSFSDHLDDDVEMEHQEYDSMDSHIQSNQGSQRAAGPSSHKSALLEAITSKNKHQALVALQDLSEILVVANEEDFMRPGGPLSINPSALVKALVEYLEPDPFDLDFDLGAELMILSCRCLYNLIEANPSCSVAVAHSKGVQALVDKLMEIQYIDLAEMALKVLEKVSLDFPSAVLKANGLFAALQFLDFFSIHVQRTAVSIVAKTCRSLPSLAHVQANSPSRGSGYEAGIEAHTKIGMVMDTIIRLLGYSDQKIVFYAAQSVSRIAEWSSRNPLKLKELFTKQHLSTLLENLKLYSDYKQVDTNPVFLLILQTICKIAKTCPLIAVDMVSELSYLDTVSELISPTGEEQDIINFTMSRPSDQTLAILDFLGDVLPPIEPLGVWKVGTMESSAPSSSATSSLPPPSTIQSEFNENALKTYMERIFPLLFDIFMSSSTLAIRKRVVVCIAKIITFSPPSILLPSLKSTSRCGKLVFELIHYHKTCISTDIPKSVSASVQEELLLVYAGLCIASIILEKCGDEFLGWFVREGVVLELLNLSGKCPDSKQTESLHQEEIDEIEERGPPPELTSLFENLINEHANNLPDSVTETQRALLLEKLSHIKRMFGTTSKSSQISLTGFTSQRIQLMPLIAHIYDTTEQVVFLAKKSNFVTGKDSDVSSILLNLVQGGVDGDVNGVSAVLADLASKISRAGNGFSSELSHFELFSGNLISMLIDFLSSPGLDDTNHVLESPLTKSDLVQWKIGLRERIILFIQTFFVYIEEGLSPFSRLVSHLQELLSRLDHLPLLSATNSTSMYPGRDTFLGLSKQVRVELVAFGGGSSCHVYVPAVASFKVLENYIHTRMQSGRKSSSSTANPGESVSLEMNDEEDDEEEEDEIDIAATPLISSATEMDLKLEKTASQTSSASQSSVSENAKVAKGAPSSSAIPTLQSRKRQYVSFFINDIQVSNDSTIFGALYHCTSSAALDSSIGNLFKTTHTIKFKVSSKRPVSVPSFSKIHCNTCSCDVCSELLTDLGYEGGKAFDDHLDLERVLFLIGILNKLNSKYSLHPTVKSEAPYFISPLQFVNNKLSSKVSRQIAEPLMAVSGIHPDWLWSLMYNYSFLFPFDFRLKYLRVSALGYTRNMTHWLAYHQTSSQSTRTGGGPSIESAVRPERLKIRIDRNLMFESMLKVMAMEGQHTLMLEVEFYNEVGSGLGPTLEFFTLVSNTIRSRKGLRTLPSEKRMQLWRDDYPSEELYLNPSAGLYPRPISASESSISSLFSSIGSFVAKGFLDSRQLDLSLSLLFLQQVFTTNVKVNEGSGKSLENELLEIKVISPLLYQSLTVLLEKPELVDDMCLDFTLPGYPDYELLPSGSNINVTGDNVKKYVRLVVDATVCSGVSLQIESFRKGFNRIIPFHYFDCFTAEEIMTLLGGPKEEVWELQVLVDAIKADHGYDMGCRLVQDFLEMLVEFDQEERRLFLSFCTGSPRLPLGGFASLSPSLTIVRKTVDKDGADKCLPSVMTCAHYLKVPEYSSKMIMRQQFLFAMKEGQNSFHLS